MKRSLCPAPPPCRHAGFPLCRSWRERSGCRRRDGAAGTMGLSVATSSVRSSTSEPKRCVCARFSERSQGKSRPVARVQGLPLFSTRFAVEEDVAASKDGCRTQNDRKPDGGGRRTSYQPKVSLQTTMPPLFRGSEGQADCVWHFGGDRTHTATALATGTCPTARLTSWISPFGPQDPTTMPPPRARFMRLERSLASPATPSRTLSIEGRARDRVECEIGEGRVASTRVSGGRLSGARVTALIEGQRIASACDGAGETYHEARS